MPEVEDGKLLIEFEGEEEMLTWSGFAETALRELLSSLHGHAVIAEEIARAAAGLADAMFMEFRKRVGK